MNKWLLIIATYAGSEWQEHVHASFETAQDCVDFVPELGRRDNEYFICILGAEPKEGEDDPGPEDKPTD